jgi:histidyl-tRNA synthetase
MLTVKDLVAGAEAAKAIKDNAEWKAERPGQFEVGEDQLVDKLKELPGVRAGMGIT